MHTANSLQEDVCEQVHISTPCAFRDNAMTQFLFCRDGRTTQRLIGVVIRQQWEKT